MGYLDKAGLAHFWGKVRSGLGGKQDKLTGGSGQVVGFSAAGAPEAQYLNLGQVQDGNPVGSVISFLGQTAPAGYLACDGAEHSVSEYPALADFFRQQFGAASHFGGDGETTFAVPDMQQSGSAVLYCIKAAVSVPAENVYSTEEQRIGTWIDGKPLYRRTFLFFNLTIPAMDVDSPLIQLSDYAMAEITSVDGKFTLFDSSSWFTPGECLPMLTANGTLYFRQLLTSNSVGNKMDGTITVEYTKTTG